MAERFHTRPIEDTEYAYVDSTDDTERLIYHRQTGIRLGYVDRTQDDSIRGYSMSGWDVYRPTRRKMLGHVRTIREAVMLLEHDRQTVADMEKRRQQKASEERT